MNRGNCNICGQRITDASGSWRLSMRDVGIFHHPSTELLICSWCKSELENMLPEFSKKQREKIEVFK